MENYRLNYTFNNLGLLSTSQQSLINVYCNEVKNIVTDIIKFPITYIISEYHNNITIDISNNLSDNIIALTEPRTFLNLPDTSPNFINSSIITFNYNKLINNLLVDYGKINDSSYSLFSITLLHETIHCLGIAYFENDINDIGWNKFIDIDLSNNSWYIGNDYTSDSITYYKLLVNNDNINKIPVEEYFSYGTVNSHWDEGVDSQNLPQYRVTNNIYYPSLKYEIMSGIANNNNYLTQITLGALKDYGYIVNYDSSYISDYPINLLYEDVLECLNTTTIVNIVNSNGNKYVFNNGTEYDLKKKYGLNIGTYIIKNIPQEHPMAILNNNKTNSIIYNGDSNKKLVKNVFGTDYDFYYGDLEITVLSDFKNISIYCYNHGYMGGKDLFIFDNKCNSTSQTSVTQITNDILDIDGNGNINIGDVSLLYRYSSGVISLDYINNLRNSNSKTNLIQSDLDINGNGNINIGDVSLLYRYSSGVISLDEINQIRQNN